MAFKNQYLQTKEWYLRKISIPFVDALLSKKVKKSSKKKVLIIKLDAIGDYVISRNALKEFSHYFKQQGYEVHLLGNELWKPFCLAFDKVFDKCFFVNRLEVTRNPSYRLKHLSAPAEEGYEIVLQAAWHRAYLVDAISRAIGKCESWVFTGSTYNATNRELAEMDKWHTRFFPLDFSKVQHELEIGEQAIELLCNKKIEIHLEFPSPNTTVIEEQKNAYLVIMMGTSQPEKKWHSSNWKRVVQYLLQATQYHLTFLGSKVDYIEAQALIDELASPRILNLCGKCSLMQSAEVVNKSDGFIGSDTGFMHISLAYKKPTVCLALVNHIGLFVPYPKTKNKHLYLVTAAPLSQVSENKNWFALQENWKNYPINNIHPEQVIEVIAKNLLNNEA